MYAPATPAQPVLAGAPLILPQIAAAATAEAASLSTPNSRTGPAGAARISLTGPRPSLNVLVGGQSSVAGRLQPAVAGQMVDLQALGRDGWKAIAVARTDGAGRFRVHLRTRSEGSGLVRLRFAGGGGEAGASRMLGRLNVYRLAEASWYGGSGGLACGGELTSTTMGVANKTLPCGSAVTLHYDGRTVRVRVIDRGPYVAGREFDLTEATKRALGFGGTGEVWSTR